jgi:hypothetical protein
VPIRRLQSNTTISPSLPTVPLSPQDTASLVPKLYGDVEYEEVSSLPLHAPVHSHPTPRHRELHETVFVESMGYRFSLVTPNSVLIGAATGKFKKTDANILPQPPITSPHIPPPNPNTPISRLFIFEQSFSLLHTIFLFTQGLLAGYPYLFLHTCSSL